MGAAGAHIAIVHTDRVRHDPAAPDPLLDPPPWAPSWLPTIDDLRGLRALRWVIAAVLFAGLAACMSRGADSPADPVLGPAPAATSDAGTGSAGAGSGGTAAGSSELAGVFGTVVAELRAASGEVLELCLLHADTAEERARGLMEVTDLQGHDGMVFSTDAPAESPFYMFRTVLPLTVVFWDGSGTFVSATDMAPCPAPDPAECPRYPPAGPYRLALEVPQGSPLTRHLVPGSSLHLTGRSCPA